uniref:Kelch-like family member 7 n=1 Tax=Cyprinus carpio TaxID=7962 RepID=A0A8C1MAM0_CYPCA
MASTSSEKISGGPKKKSEKKIASKEEYRLLSNIMGVMNNLRKQGILCDVILVVQGKHILAHRVVLAAASHFFNLMFTSSMMEATNHEVELGGAEPEIIELLVEFVYTARISVNSNNVQSLLNAANQYQIEPVKKMCVDFLKEQVDPTNCLGEAPASSAVLCGYYHVYFSPISRFYICLSCVCVFQDYSWTDIRCPFEKRRDAASVFWDNVVYILGGSQLFPIKRMDCYNVVKDSWYSKLGPPNPRDSLAACASKGKIYTSGGSEVGSSALNLFECYDTRSETWQTKPNMLMPRCSHGSVEASGLIYVCGGSLGNNVSGRVLNDCEVYDPNTEEWRALCGMREARKNHGLVVVNSRIYAVGGQNTLGGLDSVEYYEMGSNEWKMASPMPWRGVTVKCAAVGSVIYVLAGFQGVGRLGHIMEYYTETDKWVVSSKVRAFPVTSCLICLVDTCGANEEDMNSASSSSSSSSLADGRM